MKQLSSVDLYFLVSELKILEMQRVDSFYYENETFYFKIYVKRAGNKFLTFRMGKYIYLGDVKEQSSHPSSFIQYLRKYLKNGFVIEVNQVVNERIIDILIEVKDKDGEIRQYHLIFEIFAGGNVIVTDKDYNIVNSLFKKKFKDRSVKVHEKYELPPEKDLSMFDLSKSALIKQFKKEDDFKVSAFLATKFGIGGKFAREICTISGVSHAKNVADLDEKEIDLLFDSLVNLKNKEIMSFGVYKEDKLVDFIPFDFVSVKDEKKKFDSFNDVVRDYFVAFGESGVDVKNKVLESELKRLQKRLEKQDAQKEQVDRDYEKFNNVGNVIYENYNVIEEILEAIEKTSKEKGWDYVKDVIKSNDKLKKLVKKLDYKKGEIVLDLK